MIRKIVSGGQTGADRAALDWAMSRGVPHGGWCPKGRRAEDGPIPARYCLQETEAANYLVRTEQNIVDSDGTVIFTLKAVLSGGSKRTLNLPVNMGSHFFICIPKSKDRQTVWQVSLKRSKSRY